MKNAIPVEQKAESAEGAENFFPGTPVIENIHQKVYDYANQEGHLDMSSWHENEKFNEEGAHCGTTHCRAGTVVFLAGKAGRDLEKKTSTLFAAQQIYKRSSPIPVTPPRFYDSDTIALADMKRCAEEEAKLSEAKK